MNIGIIGCGIIGAKRSKTLGKNNILKAVCDSEIEKAYTLASANSGVKVFSNYKDLCKLNEIDLVIVSTINNMLMPIALEAIINKKHVLIEKPASIRSKDIITLINAQKENNVKVKVGYNIRHHPSILKAKEIINSNTIGELMFIRCRYGHGGRLNYNKEWRANPLISGGGELIDQGVHIIDLAKMFLGNFINIKGSIHTYFWDMNVEDNAFLHLETTDGKVAFLQASCTEWRNLFSFEIYGKLGKIDISGLGGSYGTEKLTLYKMLPTMGMPETTSWEYYNDNSWEHELNDLIESITLKTQVSSNLEDAFETLKIVEELYKNCKFIEGKT